VLADIARHPSTAKFIAGGTNLFDLMKMNVEHPATLIDVARLAQILMRHRKRPQKPRRLAFSADLGIARVVDREQVQNIE